MRTLNVRELKAKIKKEYIMDLESQIRINKYLLNSNNWASSGSDYHKQCRLEAQLKIEFYEKLLGKTLKSQSKKI